MILIISTKTLEGSTYQVIDWLHFIKADWQKLNGEELHENSILNYEISDQQTSLCINIDGKLISASEINVAWYRRGGMWSSPDFEQVEKGGREVLSRFCAAEVREIKSSFFYNLLNKKWLTHPIYQREVNKPYILSIAQETGFSIPATLICGTKEILRNFYKEYNSIIIKPISNPDFFTINKEPLMSYTEEIDEDFINQLPEKFTPCLAQQKIEKDIELRIFVLEDEIYSMAIFSQNDQQTQVDFRRYNNEKPNRTVPYQLPLSIEEKVRIFMKKANLNTGSIDMIKSINGEYIFLEINPVGQFGMVSYPCNYKLEKKIAKWLVKNDN